MLVVTFAAGGAGNCVVVAGRAYVFARSPRGPFVLPANCPHRGGPLHLADFGADGSRLVCPWHGRLTSVTRWLRDGIPAVRRGHVVTAVFDVPPETAYTLERRPLSGSLSRVDA